MTEPLAPDLDQRAGGGFEGVAGVEVGGAVGADDLPVGTAGQDAPAQPLALERAASDVDDTALAERRAPEAQDLGQLHLCVKQRPECEDDALLTDGRGRGIVSRARGAVQGRSVFRRISPA